jgi:colanic acid/amylovoran biosynthesis protein
MPATKETWAMAGNSPKQILITGTFCSKNKGDAAMRSALAKALQDKLPGNQALLTTPFPELDSPAYANGQIVSCSRRIPHRAFFLLARALCWNILYRLFKLDAAGILNEELKIYRRSDVVVDLSGDGLTEDYGVNCLFSHLIPIILGELLHKPVFVCAQTIGPLAKTRAITRMFLNRADAVTAREEITLEYLRSIGINSTDLSLTADLAFLLEPAPKEKALEILTREECSFDRPLVGLSVSRLPGHIHGAKSKKPTQLEYELAETLDNMVAMGLRPVLISHVTGPGRERDDRVAAQRVAGLVRRPSEVTVLAGDYSAEEIKAVISCMDLFVGMRMHSCIAALSTYVPTICIAYGPKAHGIMSQAGQGRWVHDIRDITAERLSAAVQDAWQSRFDIHESLQQHIPKVCSMAEENLNIIKQIIKRKAEKHMIGNAGEGRR